MPEVARLARPAVPRGDGGVRAVGGGGELVEEVRAGGVVHRVVMDAGGGIMRRVVAVVGAEGER